MRALFFALFFGGPASKSPVTKPAVTKAPTPASLPASQPASKPVPPKAPRTEDDELLEDLDFLEFLQLEDEAPWFVE